MTFRSAVVKYLNQFGHAVPVEGIAGPGAPDVNYCILGKEGWIELKQGRDTLNAAQKLWIRNRLRAGGTVWLLYKGIDCCYLLDGAVAVTCTLQQYTQGRKLNRELKGLEQCLTNSGTDTRYSPR